MWKHNLFGAINEAEIELDDNGNWHITKTTEGDPIDELLICRPADAERIMAALRESGVVG